MSQCIAQVSYLVRDYDEAIAWFTQVLDFELLQDESLPGGKRWVRVAPRGAHGCALLLARASNAEQQAHIGAQGGGRVWLFLQTDDFAADHARLSARGLKFLESPRDEAYATVAVFEDLYGNRWDLLQPKR